MRRSLPSIVRDDWVSAPYDLGDVSNLAIDIFPRASRAKGWARMDPGCRGCHSIRLSVLRWEERSHRPRVLPSACGFVLRVHGFVCPTPGGYFRVPFGFVIVRDRSRGLGGLVSVSEPHPVCFGMGGDTGWPRPTPDPRCTLVREAKVDVHRCLERERSRDGGEMDQKRIGCWTGEGARQSPTRTGRN